MALITHSVLHRMIPSDVSVFSLSINVRKFLSSARDLFGIAEEQGCGVM